MNEKTCSIIVTTVDGKEITLHCTLDYLEEIKTVLNQFRPSEQHGKISNGVVRLWKLGKSDKQILPTSEAVDKLLDILKKDTGKGILDIVWDDMIDLQIVCHSETPKFLFLGENFIIRTDDVRSIFLCKEGKNEIGN